MAVDLSQLDLPERDEPIEDDQRGVLGAERGLRLRAAAKSVISPTDGAPTPCGASQSTTIRAIAHLLSMIPRATTHYPGPMSGHLRFA
jgi:hypothetical protein